MGIKVTYKHMANGVKELERDYFRLKTNFVDGPTLKLTLFYAVECGIKTNLAKSLCLNFQDELPSDIVRLGHRLNRGLSELGYSKTIGQVRSHPEDPWNNETISEGQIHEAWRYGRRLNETDEDRAITELNEALEFLKELVKR